MDKKDDNAAALYEGQGAPSPADALPDPNPWVPMANPLDIKHLGKLAEEVNELGAAIARCLIQGINEREPVTGKPNRQWLTEEIADVLAGIELVCNHFDLSADAIDSRKARKTRHLKQWHDMLPPASASDAPLREAVFSAIDAAASIKDGLRAIDTDAFFECLTDEGFEIARIRQHLGEKT